MQRQKSILSFFRKPSPENRTSDGRKPAGADSAVEVTGTDTPPEKVPRQVLSASYAGSEVRNGASLFSSIKHKFAKPKDTDNASPRDMSKFSSSQICKGSEKTNEPKLLFKPEINSRNAKEKDAGMSWDRNQRETIEGLTYDWKSDEKNARSCLLDIGSDDEMPAPETPRTQRIFPRLKRIQETYPSLEDEGEKVAVGSSKKLKLLEDPIDLKKNKGEFSDTASKFEWLNPSRIKDANRRKYDDPLYDRTTLYIPPDALQKMSASQKQYWNVKCQYMDVVLFFKVGKFYELYELDAEIGHKELDWKITLSGVGKCRQVGVSESGIDEAVQKLVARGYKVGRIEQLETSSESKARGSNAVILRKLVQVISPSTATDVSLGPDAVHLLAIKEVNLDMDNNGPSVFGFAFVDCAALKFWVGSIKDDASFAGLGALLMQVSPKEILYERGLSKDVQRALRKYSVTGSSAPQLTQMQQIIDFANAVEVRNLINSNGYFKGSSSSWNQALDGTTYLDIGLSALGGLITHLSRLMLDDILRNGNILPYHVYRSCLKMDGQTLVNLEIFSNNADGGSSGTLCNYLDNCVTPSGKRLLRRWICHPLKDAEAINNRLDVVEDLLSKPEIMLLVSQYLRRIPDLERLLGNIRACVQSLATLSLPLVGKKLLKQRVKVFGTLVKGLRVGIELLQLLENEKHLFAMFLKNFKLPVMTGSEGLEKFLTQFEAAIDSDFSNYQNHEATDQDAEIISILIELFAEKATEWSEVVHAISCIDVLRSFAQTASFSSGVTSRPVFVPKTSTSSHATNCPVLKIKGLWHPFAFGDNGREPVPNDVILGDEASGYHPHTMLLTGPNMGGKSTLLRSTCIAVILAQLGCYVPSEACIISLTDTIFTRLGATDRIMTGESTFFIECTETASVLQTATQDSLVILDELGRGTSTFDGYAIAYAVLRHLIEKVNCRLLFATHYHPLTKEFGSHPHVTLQHMACAFNPGTEREELVFLYRLTAGACPKSYGLQVATMAGIPEQVVASASEAAQEMERSIGERFRRSEGRWEFSTLHEDWLRSLINISRVNDDSLDEDDVYDTLYCLWHELKSSYRSGK